MKQKKETGKKKNYRNKILERRRVARSLGLPRNTPWPVIWAYQEDEERENILNRYLSRNEISDKKKERQKIENELKKIRKAGYAVNRSAFGEKIMAVAVPIMNHDSVSFASVNITIPMARFSKNKIYKKFIPCLVEVGRLISSELGYKH